jgi:hypothetical protein
MRLIIGRPIWRHLGIFVLIICTGGIFALLCFLMAFTQAVLKLFSLAILGLGGIAAVASHHFTKSSRHS